MSKGKRLKVDKEFKKQALKAKEEVVSQFINIEVVKGDIRNISIPKGMQVSKVQGILTECDRVLQIRRTIAEVIQAGQKGVIK